MEFVNFDIMVRILSAIGFGFLLGLERELTNKYAGLRTHILVCLGACIFTILSIYGFPTFANGDNVIVHQATGIRDTGRVAAQIVTGIGFIGAGTVLRNGPIIVGLTTAATLWISAAIGMTCGVGMYNLGLVATVLSVAVLTLIRIFERKVIPSRTKNIKRYRFVLYTDNDLSSNIHDFVSQNVDNIEEFAVKQLIENPGKSKISLTFELSSNKTIKNIYDSVSNIAKPYSITLQEIND
ncbi:MAG: MgtC/SapB family protein [bacterium]|nr:MgtC/SapB family protein [bacterium]